MNLFDKYSQQIKKISLSSTRELSFRTPLENLINDLNFDPNFQFSDISIIHESSDNDLEIEGTPDFLFIEIHQIYLKL